MTNVRREEKKADKKNGERVKKRKDSGGSHETLTLLSVLMNIPLSRMSQVGEGENPTMKYMSTEALCKQTPKKIGVSAPRNTFKYVTKPVHCDVNISGEKKMANSGIKLEKEAKMG